MKHTILLAALTQTSLIPLLEKTDGLLHDAFKKYFKAFYLEEYLKLKPQIVASAGSLEIDQLVHKVEHELKVEKYAKGHELDVEIIRDVNDESTLISQSTVADLMVVDMADFQNHSVKTDLIKMLKMVRCPILLMPINFSVECFVAVHDGNLSSVRMMKRFVELFGRSFRELPISLLMTDAIDDLEIKNERVFINYLKLFFRNLGAQHMYDDVLPSLFKYIQNECDEPMLLIN
ncbi:MAG TPA: hypothetical protein VIN11_03655, partial [Roseivirga sp.]